MLANGAALPQARGTRNGLFLLHCRHASKDQAFASVDVSTEWFTLKGWKIMMHNNNKYNGSNIEYDVIIKSDMHVQYLNFVMRSHEKSYGSFTKVNIRQYSC